MAAHVRYTTMKRKTLIRIDRIRAFTLVNPAAENDLQPVRVWWNW
jgi:hypothetical protein